MGAVPKNKITSVERGKRRSGNTPFLQKNLGHADVPLYKQGLVAQIFQTIGIDSPVSAKIAKQRSQATQDNKKANTPGTSTQDQVSQTSNQKIKPQPSKVRSAQVKAQQKPARQTQDRG